MEASNAEHAGIIDVLATHHADLARSLMEAHVLDVRDRVVPKPAWWRLPARLSPLLIRYRVSSFVQVSWPPD
jgi:hypothetical protein